MTIESVTTFDRVTDRKLHLSRWKAIFYFPAHIASLCGSCCKLCASMVDFIVMCVTMSSTNSRMEFNNINESNELAEYLVV